MQPAESFHIFTSRLNSLGIRYMVSGSIAAMFYGEPRLTTDVDIIVILSRSDIPRLEDAFPMEDFYFPPREVLLTEMTRKDRGHFNLIHHETGFKADIYTGGLDELHTWGLKNSQEINTDEGVVVIAPPEYVIVRKLQFYREGKSPKHLRDISRMVTALGDTWDQSILTKMLQQYSLLPEWHIALATVD